MLIVDTDTFKERNLQKAGYEANPIEDGSLADYHVHEVALTSMTVGALKGIEGITSREAERSKNFFALGLMSWLYNRPTEGTLEYVEKKFAQAARDRAGERDRVQGRLRVRRDLGGLRGQLRDRPGEDDAGRLSADQRQQFHVRSSDPRLALPLRSQRLPAVKPTGF